MGANCTIDRDFSLWLSDDEGAHPEVTLGSRVYFGRNVFLGAYQPVTIGHDTMIGAYTYFASGNHRFDRRDLPMNRQGYSGAPIVVEADVWIGTHVVLLAGAHVERGAIVAAGSVVNGRIPAYEIWGGVPARFLKHRP